MKKSYITKIISLILALLFIFSISAQSVFAKGTYDSTYSSLPAVPTLYDAWVYNSQTSSSPYNSFDNTEEIHVTLTASLSGNVTFQGITFNVGFSGTAECTFTRERYDQWKNVNKKYYAGQKHYVIYDWEYDPELGIMVPLFAWDGTYVTNSSLTATQYCKIWQTHVFNSWVLASAYKR